MASGQKQTKGCGAYNRLSGLYAGRSIGIMPTGYEYREYKNWRGIPKPRRCPFCKKTKGEILEVGRVFWGSCPNCGAIGPKRETYNEALRAWNGRV